MAILTRLINVTGADPDDVRKRKLLNILLSGLGILVFLVLIWMVVSEILAPASAAQYSTPYPAVLGMLATIVVAYLLNRYGYGSIAAAIFCLALTIATAMADTPQLIIEGGLNFVFVLPILMSSFVMKPAASFLMATFTAILLAALAISADLVPNVVFTLGFFAIALVAWLSAGSMEDALREVRDLNTELDQRVQARTRELAEANEQLKEYSKLQTQFFSMVSHEFRTPLGIIQGFVEMLQVGVYGVINDEQHGALDNIAKGTERLLSLVNDLLDQARLAAGRLSLSIGPVALPKLLNEVQDAMMILANAKDLDLTIELAEDLPEFILGDYARLTQILVNLINNAIKFTEHGGITVKVGREGKDRWAIAISDTGLGIPQEAQKYIFDPFRQVEGGTTRDRVGSGLGLSIVSHLVDLMGGEVQLTSEIGKGSCFKVVLDLQPVEGDL